MSAALRVFALPTGRGYVIAILGGVALLAALGRAGMPGMSAACLTVCLAVPWLDPRMRHGRDVWMGRHPATVLALAAVGTFLGTLLGYGVLYGVVEGFLGAMLLHPGWMESVSWWGTRLPATLGWAAVEEWFFRGWLQRTVLAGRRGAIPLAAAAFALVHVLASGTWWYAPWWFLGGCLFGWLVARSGGCLGPAIVAHAGGNLALGWLRALVVLNLPMLTP